MDKVPCVVIGAGAIGLSVAKALSEVGIMTLVLEKHSHFAEENSSRHSEVVHAGIYYPPNSLKAKFCLEGKRLMTQYMSERTVPFNTCGKLIIACNEKDEQSLQKLHANGLANGLNDLQLLTKLEAESLEPNIMCSKAILSPSTTIFDSHNLLLNYVSDIEAADSNIVYNCEVQCIDVDSVVQSIGGASTSTSEFRVTTLQGVIACQYLINASGLHSQHTAHKMSAYPKHLIPTPYFAKGNYYKLRGCSVTNRPFSRLIYPMPSQGGLGIHATLDLSGGVRFGPNVEWIPGNVGVSATHDSNADHIERDISGESDVQSDPYAFDPALPPHTDFRVNESLAAVFCGEIAKYFPSVREDDLVPDYAGIRPKLCGPGTDSHNSNNNNHSVNNNSGSDSSNNSSVSNSDTGASATAHSLAQSPHYVMKSSADFCVQDSTVHGIKGLVQLYGIESPGVTSSLAIGHYVRDLVLRDNEIGL